MKIKNLIATMTISLTLFQGCETPQPSTSPNKASNESLDPNQGNTPIACPSQIVRVWIDSQSLPTVRVNNDCSIELLQCGITIHSNYIASYQNGSTYHEWQDFKMSSLETPTPYIVQPHWSCSAFNTILNHIQANALQVSGFPIGMSSQDGVNFELSLFPSSPNNLLKK